VLFGGEPFPKNHLAGLMDALPGCRFCNVYGPAEVNQCSFHHMERSDLERYDSVPLGALWRHADGRIVDPEGRPVPAGKPGELLVATPTMMSGYWNRPGLNEHAFCLLPDAGGGDRRYFRTGDLVVENDEGLLFFAGRADRQVKLRGYRIELDEVENALYSEPAVAEAAVFLVRVRDEAALAAAVICREPVHDLPGKLRRTLRRKLPPYAIPENIFVCEAFPRTGSNKIDHRALSARYSEPAETRH